MWKFDFPHIACTSESWPGKSDGPYKKIQYDHRVLCCIDPTPRRRRPEATNRISAACALIQSATLFDVSFLYFVNAIVVRFPTHMCMDIMCMWKDLSHCQSVWHTHSSILKAEQSCAMHIAFRACVTLHYRVCGFEGLFVVWWAMCIYMGKGTLCDAWQVAQRFADATCLIWAGDFGQMVRHLNMPRRPK